MKRLDAEFTLHRSAIIPFGIAIMSGESAKTASMANAPPIIVVYAVDPGSISANRFAWATSKDPNLSSTSLEQLASQIVADLLERRKVAIGFECPLFIPSPTATENLGRARTGDCSRETGNKPFTAAAGACAAMIGMCLLTWLLRELKQRSPDAKATTRWKEFADGAANVFLWEAFVSGSEKAKPPSHHGDAMLAIRAFQRSVERMDSATRVTCECPFSLAGAAILWAELSSDLTLLHGPTIVLRPLPPETLGGDAGAAISVQSAR
jgi:hypothetical protein